MAPILREIGLRGQQRHEGDTGIMRMSQRAECTGSWQATCVGLRLGLFMVATAANAVGGQAAGGGAGPEGRAVPPGQTEQEVPLADSLAQRIREAQGDYAEVTVGQVAEARRRLERALECLHAFLARGRAEDRDGWRRYLQLELLEEELRQGEAATLLPLVQTLRRLESGERGLTVSAFAELRSALRDYLEIAQLYATQPEALPRARAALADSLERLDSYLQGGGGDKYAGWQRYLNWSALQQQLAAGGEGPDVRVLRGTLERLQRPDSALQGARFRAVAGRLAKYAELAQLAAGISAADRYAARLERMSQVLEAHGREPSAETAAQLTSDLRWLEATGLLPDAAREVRRRFTHHNLRLAVSGQFVSRQIEDSISEAQLVNRCFEGSRVRGSATTDALVRGRLVPARGHAILDLVLSGRTVTDTVAQKRRVHVTTQGATQLSATKRVHVTLDGAYAQPAQVWASTSQRTRGVHVARRRGVRLIGRAAQRQAQRSRPRAEQLQTEEARQTIAQRMDSETDKMLTDSNVQLRRSLQQLRDDLGVSTAGISLSSTHRHLFVDAVIPGAKHLGAPHPAPRLPGKSDVALALHESAVNNLLADLLAGIKLDNRRLVELLEERNLEVPEELRPVGGEAGSLGDVPSDEDWAILFDPLLPASVTFDADQLRIAVRGREFTRGDQTIRERIEISAGYALQVDARRQLEAARVGEVAVDFVGVSGRLSTKQLTYKTFIKRKMEALFQDRISLDQLPEGDLKQQLQALRVAHLQATKGWLGLTMLVEGKLQLASRPGGPVANGRPR